MDRKPESGFTLLELTITMAIAAILLGISVPSFVEVMHDSRTRELNRTITSSAFLARSEAVKSSRNIVLCAREKDDECGTNWNKGWLVFVDEAPINGFVGTAAIGTEDTILQINDEPDSDNTIQVYGSRTGSANDNEARRFFTYTSRGDLTLKATSLVVCDPRGSDHSAASNIVLTGDIRGARPAAGEKAPRDVYNQQVDCALST